MNEKDKALKEQSQALNEKDKLIYNLAKMLKRNGVSANEIHQETGLSIDEIEKL